MLQSSGNVHVNVFTENVNTFDQNDDNWCITPRVSRKLSHDQEIPEHMKLSRKQKLRVLQFEFTAICFKIRVRELNANFATENTKGRKSNSNEANYS